MACFAFVCICNQEEPAFLLVAGILSTCSAAALSTNLQGYPCSSHSTDRRQAGKKYRKKSNQNFFSQGSVFLASDKMVYIADFFFSG